MKNFLRELKISLLSLVIFAILLCGLYPFLVWGTAQTIFPGKANGSLLKRGEEPVGSRWIGQSFTSPQYFHSRPSGAGKGYDAASSSGTNLGPTSKKLIDDIAARVEAYRSLNGLDPETKIPGDAVTSSASGLDPHISPRNAELQSARVARERNMPIEELKALIARHTDGRSLGFLGEPGVNVLELNLALDERTGHQSHGR